MVDALRLVAFFGVAGGFTLAAWGVNRRYLRAERESEDALQVFLLAVALAAATGTALGLAGIFRPVPAGVVVVGLGTMGAVLLARTPPKLRVPVEPLTPAARAALCLGLGTVLASFVLFWTMPSLLTDVLSYHLTFPARWLQEGRIVRVPAAYQAGAHAYFPVNQEVLCVWWMLPFHSEVLARFVQVPFLAAGALAVYVLSTARGLSRDAGAALAGAFLLFGPFLDEAVMPYNDVTLSTLFLLGLYACDVTRADRLRGSLLFGVSLGLFLGTKVTAVPNSLVLLAGYLLARPGWLHALVAALLAVLLGGAWYAWNWAQTGDPIYPADLVVGGLTLARGLYDPRLFPSHGTWRTLLHDFTGGVNAHRTNPMLAAALGVSWLLSHGRRKGTFAASTSPLLLAILYVTFVPLADSRYLFPVFAALALSAGAAASLFGRRWSLLFAVALAGIAFHEDIAPVVDTDRPRASIIAALALFAISPLAGKVLLLRGKNAALLLAGVLLVAAGTWPRVLRLYEDTAYAPGSELYCETYPDEGDAWSWIHGATRDEPATIAYAGTGLAFPLFGRGLRNRVLYLPVRAEGSGMVHEYGAHLGRGDFLGSALPIEAAERFVRSPTDRARWLARIEREKVDYLLVTGTDWDGGPLAERTWAEQDAQRFHLVFLTLQATVYRITR